MKRIVVLVLAVLMVLAVFTGCGSTPAGPAETGTSGAEGTPGASGGGETGDKIKLSYLETQPTEAKTAMVKEMIDQFMVDNPDITVEFISVPNDQAAQKLFNLAAANQLPDIIELNDSWLASLAAAGHLEDLQPYVDKWDEKDNIVDDAIGLGKVMNDTLYYIPYGLWGTAVYYNTEMLESTGMEPPVTQEDLYNVAKAMTEKNPGKYGYAMRGGMYGPTHALMWMLGEAGTPYVIDPETGKCTLDSPEAINGLEKYAKIYQDGYASPDAISWAFRECVESFTTESSGMVIQSNEVVQICNEQLGEGKFDTTMLPVGASGKTYDTSGQTGYAMSANSADKEAAWKLMSYLLDPEVSKDYVVSMGFTPINKKLADDPAFSEGPVKVYFEQIMSDKIEFAKLPSYLPEWGEIVGEYGTGEIQKMLLGEQTAEVTAKNLAAFLNDAEAKYRSES